MVKVYGIEREFVTAPRQGEVLAAAGNAILTSDIAARRRKSDFVKKNTNSDVGQLTLFQGSITLSILTG